MTMIDHDFPLDEIALAEAEAVEAATRQSRRKKLFLGLASGVAVIAAGYSAYGALVGSHHVVTDNAYVGADVALVTPQIGGPVQQVLVQDAQSVRRGDVLVRLDDTDARILYTSC